MAKKTNEQPPEAATQAAGAETANTTDAQAEARQADAAPAMPAEGTLYVVISPIRIGADRIEPGTDDSPRLVALDAETAKALLAVKAVATQPE